MHDEHTSLHTLTRNPITLQLKVIRTSAAVTSRRVIALPLTWTLITLIDVIACLVVIPEMVSCTARAVEGTVSVHALLFTCPLLLALVYIYARSLVIGQLVAMVT